MSILERFQSIEEGVVAHARRIARFEEGPANFIIATTVKCRQLLRHVFMPTPKQRKQAIYYVKLGVCAHNAKSYDEAEENFLYAIAHDGKYARALTYLGNTYYKMDQLPDALKMWGKAVASEPKSEAAKKAEAKLSRYGARIHEV